MTRRTGTELQLADGHAHRTVLSLSCTRHRAPTSPALPRFTFSVMYMMISVKSLTWTLLALCAPSYGAIAPSGRLLHNQERLVLRSHHDMIGGLRRGRRRARPVRHDVRVEQHVELLLPARLLRVLRHALPQGPRDGTMHLVLHLHLQVSPALSADTTAVA